MSQARHAEVTVIFDGTNITKSITPYLLSLSYTDSEEDESDDLEIQLQDREGLWLKSWLNKAILASAASKLKIGAAIALKGLGVRGGVLPAGEFELDSVSAGGPPATVTIRATALPYSAAIRQTKKSRAWEAYTLSGIAKEITKNAGMKCLYTPKQDPFYQRTEQEKTSDIAFLSDLCHDAGISLKCTDRRLVLFDQAEYEARPSVLTICRGDGQYISYDLGTNSAETQYASCRVSYTDPATGKCVEGKAKADPESEGGQCLEIAAKVKSGEEAKALAEKWLKLKNKFSRTASFTLPGNTGLVAGIPVSLKNWGGWDGKYMIKQAVHSVGQGGYETKISLRKIEKGA